MFLQNSLGHARNLLLATEIVHLILRMRRLVGHHAGMRLLQGGAAARATDRVCDPVNASGTPLSLGHVAGVTTMTTLAGQRPLMIVVQILTTLVDV